MMRTLAEAEARARASTARRRRQEHAQAIAASTDETARRLQAAQDLVDARRHRQAAVQAVLHSAGRPSLRGLRDWFDTALLGTPDSPAAYEPWFDWERP